MFLLRAMRDDCTDLLVGLEIDSLTTESDSLQPLIVAHTFSDELSSVSRLVARVNLFSKEQFLIFVAVTLAKDSSLTFR